MARFKAKLFEILRSSTTYPGPDHTAQMRSVRSWNRSPLVVKDANDYFGIYEELGAACDDPGRIDDLGLCQDCGGKLERDLLRQRDWAYSATAYGLSDEQRERARREIVKQFGKDLELIAAPKDGERRKRRKRGKPRVH